MESASLTAAGFPPDWDPGRDLAVFVGRGSGALVDHARALGQERVLVCLPPECAEDGEPPPPAGAPTVRSRSELLAAVLALDGVMPARVAVRRSNDPRVTPPVHERVAREVHDALRARRLQLNTVDGHGPTWLLQGIGNLDAIGRHPSIERLRGAFAGCPCVIVSPGPSLSRNLAELAGLKGRALLMTGSHALHALRGAGVIPDLVVVADPGDFLRHFEAADTTAFEALVVGATCRRENFELPARRVFAFAANGQLDAWIFEALGEEAGLATGGSVACSELSLAVAMGCDPIVLVGQDLSFPDGRYYAAESLDGEARVVAVEGGRFHLEKPAGSAGPGDPKASGALRFSRDRGLRAVPGYHGGTVPTSAAFESILTWFGAAVTALGGVPRVVNSTGGGARIEGTEQLPLADVSAPWPAGLDVAARLDRALAGFDPRERERCLARALARMGAALGPCLELASRCRELALGADRDPERLEELTRLERRLSEAVAPLACVSLVAHGEVLRAKEAARVATTLAENLAAARRIHLTIERAVRLLREPLARSARRLAGA